MSQAGDKGSVATKLITFERHPDTYRRWKLNVAGDRAELITDVEQAIAQHGARRSATPRQAER